MNIWNTCMICLNLNENLTDISIRSSANTSVKLKLEKCIPEVEWRNSYKICSNCSEQVDNIYNFREICTNLDGARFSLWKEITELKSTDVTDHNFTSNVKALPLNNIKIEIIEYEQIGHESNTFFCFHCDEMFQVKTGLAEHIENFHPRLRKYICKYCRNCYVNRSSCMKHERLCFVRKANVQFKPVEQSCSEIGDKFQESCEQNKCDICETTFKTKYLLNRHKRNVHATEKNFKCDECSRSFVSPVYLNAHKKYHSGDRKHICSFCGKGYKTASDLYHHEKIHGNKRAYKCSICDKAFNTSSDLHKHKICVHTDRNLWKYSCEYCMRKFPLKTNLTAHVKTHTGERNFSCHLCEKKCISKSSLTRHLESHVDEKSFTCKECNLGYKHKKSLEFHMARNHGIGELPERIKKYFCHLCPKTYYSNCKLEKHIRSHTGEKPFKCPLCDKHFVDKTYIKRHLRSAHVESTLDLL